MEGRWYNFFVLRSRHTIVPVEQEAQRHVG
jgi:hypothetical protein